MLFSFYSTVIPTAATPATQWKVYRGAMGPQRGTEEHGHLLLDLLPRKGSYINRPKIHLLLFVFELFCFVLNPQITLLSSSHLSYSSPHNLCSPRGTFLKPELSLLGEQTVEGGTPWSCTLLGLCYLSSTSISCLLAPLREGWAGMEH